MDGPIRVLLCDDHVVVREGLHKLLAEFSQVQVVGQAVDGVTGVEAARDLRPDVVLMDLSMPNMDVVEATRQITTELSGVRVLVLVLTSFAEGDRVRAAIEAGAAGYVLTDSAPEELVRAIGSVVRGESPIDPRAARAYLAGSSKDSPQAGLKPREREVLELLRTGLTNRAIALGVGISDATVKAHLTQIYRQLGVTDRTQAALWAQNQKFLAWVPHSPGRSPPVPPGSGPAVGIWSVAPHRIGVVRPNGRYPGGYLLVS